ncbi:MAG: hypothetical protein Q7R39_10130, partial [Dehalococcoidia bacterium]|nr:hypothetical protein [Dehalococcoidia bacterium]
MMYPFDEALEGYPWSRSVQTMFASLRKQCEDYIKEEPGVELTPDMVLLGILRFGQQHRSNSQFLAGRLSAIANKSDEELSKLL